MNDTRQTITRLLRADREARTPCAAPDPLIERLDQAILTLGSLPARPRFHDEARARAGLGGHHFPSHPARRLDAAPYGVLAALAGCGMPGPMSIAIRLGLSPSTISHHVARLESRGLVERSAYAGNRRWSNTRLTSAGRVAFETVRDARHEALAAIVASWEPDEVVRLVEVVARLADTVRRHNLEAYRETLERRRQAAHAQPIEVKEDKRRLARERYASKKAEQARHEAERRDEVLRRRQTTLPDTRWQVW